MEAQMSRVEMRVRAEEKERRDAEKDELKAQLEAEITELRSNLNRLQKVNCLLCLAFFGENLNHRRSRNEVFF